MSVDIADGNNRVRFSDSIALTKDEAFEVCEACAQAEQCLRITGLTVHAVRLAGLIDLIEGRLAGV